ncbi:P-loop containing nucleoside triphosphate hydrolase protein [Cristinia sonorae]|uniref:RNA helicase n=1 Tax=Cristinia sonorae TaxID=1940300 RepID=A0A8K0XK95_9AGAR|nr:P-loop containing nucleoside triphosphate hydrolase protein [Cristinia sonorae]
MAKVAALKGIFNFRSSLSSTPKKSNGHGGGSGSHTKLKRRLSLIDSDECAASKGHGNGFPSPNGTINGRPGSKKMRLQSARDAERSPAKGHKRQAPVKEQREKLPIALGRDAIVEEIRRNDVTILVGETGSGKTTQVPQYLLEAGIAGDGVIAITQPRKVAATSLAARVAVEQGVPVGGLVGYSVRFDESTSNSTRIKYVTDGMIIRELLSDELLSKYSIVIVDEAHERTLRTDLLLANLKSIIKRRNAGEGTSKGGKEKGRAQRTNPLKVVIMSATLDAEKFSKYYGNAKVLYVQGRQHPVTIYHTAASQQDYVDSAMRTFYQIHTDWPPGDVLIFLPGQEDIENLEKSVELYSKRLPVDIPGVAVLPMYAALPPNQQSAIFAPAPHGMRKCILATNIAETSITIPGIKYVIDTGKCKEKRYISRDTGTGFDTLLTKDITQSSAMQRAGRAGREGPGYCFRLYTEDAFKSMPLSAEPEIRRVTLTSSLLQLKCLGQDLEKLDFIDKPEQDSIASALATLYLLGALDDSKSLTPLGRTMAHFPLEPTYARTLAASFEHGCPSEILSILSVLSASSKLFIDNTDTREAASESRSKFRAVSGDHMTILNIVKAYEEIREGKGHEKGKAGRREWCKRQFLNERCLSEALEIRAQLRGVCERMKMDWTVSAGEGNDQPVLKSLLSGLVNQAAFLQADGSYKQIMGPSIVKIHPSSSLCDKKVPVILYDELVYTSQIYARGVSAISRSAVQELAVFKRRHSD